MNNEFRLIIDHRIIWDCEEFASIIKQSESPDYTKMILQVSDEGYASLNGWKFNVHSTIYSGASASEIVEGQQLLDSHAPNLINKLLEIFFLKSVSEFQRFRPTSSIGRFCEIEPESLDLLRLCYWFKKCVQIQNSNFLQFKSPEVKRKLANGLLSNIEDYATKVADDFPGGTDEEFLVWLQDSLNKAILPKPPDRNFKIFMKKLSEDIRSINSELMFAALCNYNDYKISFDTSTGPDHDFDFLINSLPVQVKTFNPSEDREKSIKKIEELERNQSLDPNKVEKVIFF